MGVDINKDLLTGDLKKKRSTNESFWLMGQPDIKLEKNNDGKYIVKVQGFDYYDTKEDEIRSGDSSQIAMWMLDTDYDGRSVYPQQVFFPMDGETKGWSKLAKVLQSDIDEELITKYQGTESIPFESGTNKRAAVKIIDNRGIESLKIIQLE
jgi:adenine-specific DNA-methyltransferase